MEYRERLSQAHEQLVNSYLKQIRETYLSLPMEDKAILLRGLENLLEETEETSQINSETRKKVNRRARQIREKEGLTQKELAKELGINQCAISRYETGDAKKRGKAVGKYVDWLKQKGYKE